MDHHRGVHWGVVPVEEPLLLQSKLAVHDATDGAIRCPMGSGKVLNAHAVVFGDGRDYIGGFLLGEPSLIISVFSHLNSLQNLVNLGLLEGHVPINIIHQFFDVSKAFSALGEVHNKVMHSRHG